MKYIYLYIIDGFAAIAISYRPFDALHMTKRVYYKLTGATIGRLCATNHKCHFHTDKATGTQLMTIVLKGEI